MRRLGDGSVVVAVICECIEDEEEEEGIGEEEEGDVMRVVAGALRLERFGREGRAATFKDGA